MRKGIIGYLVICLLLITAFPVRADDGVVRDLAGNPLVDPYTDGESYDVIKETPTPSPTPVVLTRIYVNASATGANNGSSWQDAFTDLQSALAVATPDKPIWVAKGVYFSSFALVEGIQLYGGFAGNETELSQRNPALNLTVLSGDIDRNDRKDGNGITWNGDIVGSNAYHVVTAGDEITAATVLDGFVITAGQATGNNDKYGGGMLVGGSPTIRDTRFIGNVAQEKGGGLYVAGNAMPQLIRVEFRSNQAVFGGGMAVSNASGATLIDSTFTENMAQFGAGLFSEFIQSSLTVIGSTFMSNAAQYNGGGVNHYGAGLTIVNSTFSGNTAFLGGGLYNTGNGTPSLTNVTFAQNGAIYGGGIYNDQGTIRLYNSLFARSTNGGDCVNSITGYINSQSANNLIESTGTQACGLVSGVNGNIIGVDAKLGDLTDNGGNTLTHALLAGSPAAGAGKASSCPEVDQRGVTRPQPANTNCDIGAFESDEPLPATMTPTWTPTWTFTPTPSSSPTPTWTFTPSPSPSPTVTETPTPTWTLTPTPTWTWTPTLTNTPDGTQIPSQITPSPTPTSWFRLYLPLVVK
ncbi:MAG: Outer membrane autotransporter barrel [Anaerolineae bacterium]|nr:MAG: Outer membrane autotransporter barrel [Anaerolineae bacterium]